NQYTKTVDRGIRYLRKKQTKEGDFEGMGSKPMYEMGMATMALCEDYHASGKDPTLREPSQRAVNFILKAQDPRKGGCRYPPLMAGDLSVVSWQVQALKSAQLAGLNVPKDNLERAFTFVQSCALAGDDGYGYRPSAGRSTEAKRPTMVAAGILCRQYLRG